MEPNKELLEEYKKKIAECGNEDTETGHGIADDLLCELLTKLGYKEVADEFKKLPKWYA